MILDATHAFLYGGVDETVYINLPGEDPMGASGYVGILKKSMYGTRKAPQVWQLLVRSV